MTVTFQLIAHCRVSTAGCLFIPPVELQDKCGAVRGTYSECNVRVYVCVNAGVPVSSRVSAKIQQLVNTLKRPKRPPLREFFVDDFEELLEGTKLIKLGLISFMEQSWGPTRSPNTFLAYGVLIEVLKMGKKRSKLRLSCYVVKPCSLFNVFSPSSSPAARPQPA